MMERGEGGGGLDHEAPRAAASPPSKVAAQPTAVSTGGLAPAAGPACTQNDERARRAHLAIVVVVDAVTVGEHKVHLEGVFGDGDARGVVVHAWGEQGVGGAEGRSTGAAFKARWNRGCNGAMAAGGVPTRARGLACPSPSARLMRPSCGMSRRSPSGAGISQVL